MAINVVVDKGSRPTLMSAFHPAWHPAANRTATKTKLSTREPYTSVATSTIGVEVAAVRWNVAGNVVTAWILTMPAATLMGAAFYQVCKVWP
jgi:phosphate/sulfate permease